MLQIIKYQLMDRKNGILLTGGIITLFNLIAFTVETLALVTGKPGFTTGGTFWVPISIAITVIMTTVMFFICGSGHVKQLLYKDTNYLMLTLPRHGWEILGGRFIAGLAEFLIYGLLSALFLTVHAVFGIALAGMDGMNFTQAFAFVYRQLIGFNFIPLVQCAFILLFNFTWIGIFLTFAVVASRSLVKNKGIATIIAVIVFITVINWSVKLGTSLSEKLNWYSRIRFMGNTSELSLMFPNLTILPRQNEMGVALVPFLIFGLIATALFAAASWLMEEKVEV